VRRETVDSRKGVKGPEQQRTKGPDRKGARRDMVAALGGHGIRVPSVAGSAAHRWGTWIVVEGDARTTALEDSRAVAPGRE